MPQEKNAKSPDSQTGEIDISDPLVQQLLQSSVQGLAQMLDGQTQDVNPAQDFEDNFQLRMHGNSMYNTPDGQQSMGNTLSPPQTGTGGGPAVTQAMTGQGAPDGPAEKITKNTLKTGESDNLKDNTKPDPEQEQFTDLVERYNSEYSKANEGSLMASQIGTGLTILGALLGVPGLAAGGMALTGAGERRISDWQQQWNRYVSGQEKDRADSFREQTEVKEVTKQLSLRYAKMIAKDEDTPEERLRILDELLDENADNKNLTEEDRELLRKRSAKLSVEERLINEARKGLGEEEGAGLEDEAAENALDKYIVENFATLSNLTPEKQRAHFVDMLSENIDPDGDHLYGGLTADDAMGRMEAKSQLGSVSREEADEIPDSSKHLAPTKAAGFWLERALPGMDQKNLEDEFEVPGGNPILDNLPRQGLFSGRKPGTKTTVGDFIMGVDEALLKAMDPKLYGKNNYYMEAVLSYDYSSRADSERKSRRAGYMAGEATPRTGLPEHDLMPPVRIFKDPWGFSPSDQEVKDRLDLAYADPQRYFSKDFLDWIETEVIRLGF